MADSITINKTPLSVWPDEIEVFTLNQDPPMFWIRFDDVAEYHDALRARILELEADDSFTHRMEIGGSKVANVHQWGIPEADLIHARAVEFFARAMGKSPSEVKLDSCWASVTRQYEYLTPHAHTNAIASIVYMLDPGEKKQDNYLDGRLAFVDPRIPYCCPHPKQPDIATNELAPDMVEGAMVFFPSSLLHFVHPYTGVKPRISIAWNFYL